MPTEVYANDLAGAAALSSSISSTDAALVASTAAGFPATGNFRIRVEQEYMMCTAVSGTTFTVTRGIEGTTAVAHSSGVAVQHVITAGGFARTFLSHARYPASNGFVVPDLTGYSWFNQGGATLTVLSNGHVNFQDPAVAATDNFRFYLRAVPSAPPYRLTALFQDNCFFGTHNPRWGLCWYNGTSTASLMMNLNNDTGVNGNYTGCRVMSCSSPSSGGSSIGFAYLRNCGQWLQLTDDGAHWNCNVSRDGLNFLTITQLARNTSVTPTHIGLMFEAHDTTFPYNMTLVSLEGP
jgi:hypothetical protein